MTPVWSSRAGAASYGACRAVQVRRQKNGTCSPVRVGPIEGGEEETLLEESFSDVYTKFKLHFYQEIFSRFQNREASLTAVETFCMEIIFALKEPTINEFASFVRISSPNAAYKVNNLIRKGYVEKVQSPHDRREYHLRPTQKYMNYYNIGGHYHQEVMNRVRARFTPEEAGQLDQMLQIMARELMPEVTLKESEG